MIALLFGLAHATSSLPSGPLRYSPPDALPAEGIDPLALTSEMRVWLTEHVGAGGTPAERMHRLVEALRYDLALRYTNARTGTAREVFEGGAYNCLGLTHLVVALGRALDVDVGYVRVHGFRTYHAQGLLVMSSTHVAAAWGPEGHEEVIEIEDVSELTGRNVEPISDQRALALHLANRGAEVLLVGAPGVAWEWLDRAVRADPGLPEAWVNLGVAWRRTGDTSSAEAAWRRAIALDPDHVAAWRNLGALYESLGDVEGAQQMMGLAASTGPDHPYTWLALGDLSARLGDREAADRAYHRASFLKPGDPEILAARGLLACSDGDEVGAQRLLERAARRDSEAPRVEALTARVRACPRRASPRAP